MFEEISYWAPAQARQTEVDFLLRRGRDYLALEIKAHSRFSTPQLSGLRAIATLPRLVRRVLVYLGDRRLRTEDGVEVWPLNALLKADRGAHAVAVMVRRLRPVNAHRTHVRPPSVVVKERPSEEVTVAVLAPLARIDLRSVVSGNATRRQDRPSVESSTVPPAPTSQHTVGDGEAPDTSGV